MNKTLQDLGFWIKALALLGLGLAALLVFDQYYYWSNMEDYSFGYFVPLFAAYVIYDRWPVIRAYLLGVAKPQSDNPAPSAAGNSGAADGDSGAAAAGNSTAAAGDFAATAAGDDAVNASAKAALAGSASAAATAATDSVKMTAANAVAGEAAGAAGLGSSEAAAEPLRPLAGTPEAKAQQGIFETLLNSLVPLGMVPCLLVFALGGLVRAGQGPAGLSSLMLCVGFAGYVLGAAYLISAGDVYGRVYSLRRRLGFTFLFTFPALVWLISGPMVEYFASDLSVHLQGIVALVVDNVFNVLGMPLYREGSVLVMASGQVGVADACTGIRSLTGCIFAGCFLATVFLDRFWKKVLLVAIAMLLAFVTNLLRGLFLTGWAYRYGPEAIEGTVHDVTGYAVLGITTVLLLLLLPLFQLKLLPEGNEASD